MITPFLFSQLFRTSPISSELGQAKVRVLNVMPVCLYFVLAWHFQWHAIHSGIAIGALAYIGYTLLWLFLVAHDRLPATVRRITAAVLDQAFPALGMYLAGFLAGYVAWVPALGAIGSGLRFGTRYAWISSLIGAPMMGLAMSFSVDWSSVPQAAIGIIAANALVPLYAVILVKRLERANQSLLAHAAHLEHVSRHDPLTGLLNRAGFVDALLRLQQPGSRPSKDAVMVLDLDGFKEINDTLGHQAGDMMLVAVATAIKQALRAQDSVARWGGDEFAVILNAIGSQRDVEALAGRILKSVADLPLPKIQLTLSVSIGACLLPNPDLGSMDDIMAAADRLMYEAKAQGKNQARILG